jgi:hypothetical protein
MLGLTECGGINTQEEPNASISAWRITMSTYEFGDHIKVEFKDDLTGKSEWMWVKVDYCDDESRLVFGWLDGEPIVDHGVRLGAHLAVSYDKVRERERANEFED